MPVPLSQIPSGLLVPGMYQEIDNSLAGDLSDVKKVLIVDLMSSAGEAVAGVPVVISSKERARILAGEGSPAALAAINFLDLNKVEQLLLLPLAEKADGIAAIKKIAVTAVAPEPGTLVRYIGGQRVSIGIVSADTAAIIAGKLQAAINATQDMPAEAAIGGVASEVTLTATVKGEFGNDIDVVASPYGEADPAGVTLAVTVTTPGSGNPSIAATLASLGDVRYHYKIDGITDAANLVILADDLTDRYSATRQIGCRAFVTLSGPVGDATTNGSMIKAAASINNPHLALVPRGNNPQLPCVWAARFAACAVRALADDPAANTQGIEIPGLIVTDNLDFDQRQKLLEAGVITYKTDSVGTALIERLVTSYTENAQGSRDTSYLDMQVVETIDAMRTYTNATAAKRFQKWKLASTTENFGSGSRVMTREIWKGFLIELYQKVFILEKQWCQDLAAYKDSINVEVKAGSKTRLEYQHQPVLIGQFLIGAGLTQFK